MMNAEDTIAAVSSAVPRGGDAAVSILRISGAETFAIIGRLAGDSAPVRRRGITSLTLVLEGAAVPAAVYAFTAPHSYTGQDMIELHVSAAGSVVEILFSRLLDAARQAGPGEFTRRAYLNGRMDLTQAEAVAQIVSGSNAVQVTAAEKLLAGNLSAAVGEIRGGILELLGGIEAGLDFAEEDIEFVTAGHAAETLADLAGRLHHLLGSTIHYERMIDLPSAGIAGAVNAGKSSLLNALLRRERSIVSERRATTRDVLPEICLLGDLDCVLFDCAGLAESSSAADPLDAMAQQAARSALQGADAVLLCVDITKEDLTEDLAVRVLPDHPAVLAAATQCDRVPAEHVPAHLARLEQKFGCSFLPCSARTGEGLAAIKRELQNLLVGLRGAGAEADQRIAVNQRHRRILTETAGALAEARAEIQTRREEIAAMLLRNAWQQLGGIEREDVEEAVLDQIFSRFCVGK